ncbi:adenosylcobinamide-phosphate synthase CbiB [Mucilaginibacter aquaedulcis]|uniref:adenosylcobinamide-phosphate synthase CbiB n=1 Tax=Mucilaginibacter aquaedulcis TaxID=1187081 RepID=UPI0025B2BEEC|nr:adenosylcobinamide-phosphate synthase CbiB [Mucilaginibacter aquaedulcis]MDN3548220.1 adenosylcobinamide-phosphate synthase CbiB [Mucilaginibacter aquaedulcis]
MIAGYLLDLALGDPEQFPHPVKFFGNIIGFSERSLNKNRGRFLKGMLLVTILCGVCFLVFYFVSAILINQGWVVYTAYSSIFVYFGLANKGLINEGKKVFDVLNKEGIEAGRKQLSRIVGRDTSNLSIQQIRIAVLETMSENLSDGVIAPLFYYAVAGIPGMMTYKLINTFDSMIGYRSERYEQFGKFAARLDDVTNFIPSRLTAVLMIGVSFSKSAINFVLLYGNKHKSPNAGYPEAALAGILDTRFGGPNTYHGILFDKPFIGKNDRIVEHQEIKKVININHKACLLMIILIIVLTLTTCYV